MDPLEDHSSPASGSCIVKGGWAGVPREGPLCHKKSVLRQITFSIDYGGAHTPWMPHSGYSVCPFLISHLPPPSPSQCPPPPRVCVHTHMCIGMESTRHTFSYVFGSHPSHSIHMMPLNFLSMQVQISYYVLITQHQLICSSQEFHEAGSPWEGK